MANLLQTRHKTVTIVTVEGEEEVCVDGDVNETSIEILLVNRIIALHSTYHKQ